MAIASTAELLDALRNHSLLDARQLAALRSAPRAEPKALLDALVRRGWLTSYQAEQLLAGHGDDLVFGPYVLLEPLGEGGMGLVFKARDVNLGRTVAIKLLRKERVENATALERFKREMRAAAALSHPNIVQVFDTREIDGTHLMVMEFLDGAIDLAKLVKSYGPLPIAKACDCIRQAALGLQHAHERQIVHRDIKPANLILTPTKSVKILDMGLARIDSALGGDKSATMTQQGTLMGTPDYLAPEQAQESHTVDIRADIYALGCTFYFLLSGSAPFAGGSLVEKIFKHRLEEPTPIEQVRPETPREVGVIVRKMMAKKPADRYQTPAEVVAAIDALSGVLARLASTSAAQEQTIALENYVAAGEAKKDTVVSASDEMTPRDAGASPDRQRLLVYGALASGVALFALAGIVVLAVIVAFVMSRSTPADKKLAKVPEKKTAKETDAVKPLPPPPAGKDFTNSLDMKFVWIAPGSFLMGSPDTEKQRGLDEVRHKVTLTRGFHLATHLVTQEQWQKIMGDNPSVFQGEKGLPVDNVSWNDCQSFIEKLSDMDKRRYRLPTEAEWEYACRAGTTTPFHFGNTLSSEQANFDGTVPYGDAKKGVYQGKTTRVGYYPANAWGLFDMHGNLRQFCQDYYADYPNAEVTDPKGPASGTTRVLRGGSWRNQAAFCRSASRYTFNPGIASHDFGLRLCVPGE